MDMNSINGLISNIASVDLEDIDENEEFGEMYFWDSLKHTEFLLEIETLYNIRIPIELLGELNNVNKLKGYLNEQ